MVYKIEYSETFLNTYEVDADSFEEAKKILEEDIYYGRTSEPWECVETHYEDVTERGTEMAVVKKRIVYTEPVCVLIKGITLLSIEEYEATRDMIPMVKDDWWLRSLSDDASFAMSVGGGGEVYHRLGTGVLFGLGVRPVLNLELGDLRIGDVFELAGYMWTVINGNMALCNDIIGECCFRDDWKAKDANDYEKSDIKKWLENWAKEKGVID